MGVEPKILYVLEENFPETKI